MNHSQEKQKRNSTFSKMKEIYIIQYLHNPQIISIAHILQFIIAGLVLLILYFSVSSNFIYGFYIWPINIIISLIQIVYMKRGNSSPSNHWIYQLIAFIVFTSTFTSIYVYVYRPTFKQNFQKVKNCSIQGEARVLLQDGSYVENFQVFGISFSHNDQTHLGCGCGSDKNQESIFQTKIEPFRYVSNSEMQSLDVTTRVEKEDISYIKMPSWMCQPFNDISSQLELSPMNLDTCYFNVYGDESEAYSFQNKTNYCSKSQNFFQVIFQEKPYFPLDSFCLLLAFTFLPIFSLSLNWILVQILHAFFPSLHSNLEKKISNPQFFYNNSKVAPKEIITSDKQLKDDEKTVISKNLSQVAKELNCKARDNFTYIEEVPTPMINIITNSSKSSLSKGNKDILHINCNQNGQDLLPIPSAKKKVLPPIKMSFNYQETAKQNIMAEIQKEKQFPSQVRLSTENSHVEVVNANQIPVNSILTKNIKKDPTSSMRKINKVQFKQEEETQD